MNNNPRPLVDWWGQTWVPKLQKSIISNVVTVVPESKLANFSTKDWQAQDFGGMVLKNVKTVAEAEEYLSQT